MNDLGSIGLAGQSLPPSLSGQPGRAGLRLTPRPWAEDGLFLSVARVSVCGTGRDGTAVFGRLGVGGREYHWDFVMPVPPIVMRRRWARVSLGFVTLVPPIMRLAGGDLRRSPEASPSGQSHRRRCS
jgi:hypothetical protein